VIIHSYTNCVTEVAFRSTETYADPYNDVDLDVAFTGPKGKQVRIPAFWAGDNVWKVRFAAPERGTWKYATTCSRADDAGLQDQKGAVIARRYKGSNDLLKRGRLRVAESRRTLETADGTPFFWLGDTWWMGLCSRIDWPQGFQALVADRVAKGFSVIQIIAGPLPDMDAFDPRGRNEAGYPFSEGFERLNPAYYDLADLKIGHLVGSGLVPCIVGMWGYYLPQIGVERVKRYWRYVVARYAAYPVVWCIAGEATMPYYLSKAKEEEAKFQRKGWTEVAASVRKVDGFHNPITIHPTQFGHLQVEDPSVLDLDMLQTGHGGFESIGNTGDSVNVARNHEPRMPVLVGEVNYEGILGRSWQDVQRMAFWVAVLNGACGHTYGASGIWQMSTKEQPYGLSPHGHSWGNTPWQEAARLPGSTQLGLARKLLVSLRWWEMEPHGEWVEPAWEKTKIGGCCAAGVPGKLRVIYAPMLWDAPLVKGIEPGVSYEAFYFNPIDGKKVPIGRAEPTGEGTWRPPTPPEAHDWVIVMTAS